MASNPYGIQEPKPPAMPGMVQKMSQGMANDAFKFKNEKDIWKMTDKARTDYWKSLEQFRGKVGEDGQVGEDDQRFKDYRSGLSDTMRADYDSTHLNLTGAPQGTPGANFYITPEARLKHIQEESANEFRAGIDEMRKGMVGDLTAEANRGLSNANRNTQQEMSNRGLLHSGLNQAKQAGNRARSQAGVAQGIMDINKGLNDAADAMDMDAIQTGMGIQQAQQQIQNQVYSQAMARMAAHNQAVGAGLGFLTTAGMAYAGGGKK